MNRILQKVIVIGNSRAEKTDLVHQILETPAPVDPGRPNPMDFYTRVFSCQDSEIKMVVWDLAGESRFSMVRKSCYAGAQAAIIVIDPTENNIEQDVRIWLAEMNAEMSYPATLLVENHIHNPEAGVQLPEDLMTSVQKVIQADTSTGEGIAPIREWLLDTAVAKAQPVI